MNKDQQFYNKRCDRLYKYSGGGRVIHFLYFVMLSGINKIGHGFIGVIDQLQVYYQNNSEDNRQPFLTISEINKQMDHTSPYTTPDWAILQSHTFRRANLLLMSVRSTSLDPGVRDAA